MKTIKSIAAVNFKGRSFTHELAPINIVTGPNDSGKTAVADAIRVGLLGYLPSLGKTAGATFQLATGKAMSVRVDMNGGGTVSREWELKKGRVSSKGADSGFPDMLFDLKPFFSLTANARTDYLLSLIPDSEVGPDSFLSALGAWEGVAKEDREKLEADFKAAVAADGASVSKWTMTGLTWLGSELSKTQANIKATEGFAATQVQLQASDDEVENVRSELAAVDSDLAEINGRLKALEAEETGNRDMARLRSSLIQKASVIGSIEKTLADLNALKAEVDGITIPDLRPLEDRKATAATVVNKLTLMVETSDHRIGELDMELDSLMQSDNCPHCGTAGEVWKPIAKAKIEGMMKAEAEKLDQLRAELTHAEATLAAASEALKEGRAAWDAANSKQRNSDMLASEIRVAETNLKEAREARETLATLAPESPWSRAEEVVALRGKRSELETRRGSLREKHNLMIASMQDAKRAAQAKQRLDTLKRQATSISLLNKALAEFREQAVTSKIGVFLRSVNAVTEGILPSPIEYLGGEFGRFEGAQWISLDVFGETYRTLTAAGLCLALAKDAPVKIVIIDELGKLDASNKAKLMARVRELIAAGTIHQFIGIDVEAAWATETEVNVIRVTTA